jgi:hypothetical protein
VQSSHLYARCNSSTQASGRSFDARCARHTEPSTAYIADSLKRPGDRTSTGRMVAPQQVVELERRHTQSSGELLRVAAGDGESLGSFIEGARQVDGYPATEDVSNRISIDADFENTFRVGQFGHGGTHSIGCRCHVHVHRHECLHTQP